MKTPTQTETELFFISTTVDKLRMAHEFLYGMSDVEVRQLMYQHHVAGWPTQMVRIIARMLNEL